MEEEHTRQTLAGTRATIRNLVENDACNDAEFMDLSDEKVYEDEDLNAETFLDDDENKSNKEQTECGKSGR